MNIFAESLNRTMEKEPDHPEDVSNEPLPSLSEPMEVQDAIASLTTPFAHPRIAASKSKAQRQRDYRQRIAASRTPAQAAAARKSKNERQRKNRHQAAMAIASALEAEPITPKTRAQIQREYRQRIAASKTPAQAAAAREARNVRDRNNRLRQAIASGSLETKTQSSSGQKLNTVHIDQRQFTDQQRHLATEPVETTVPRSSDEIEIDLSTWNNKWPPSIKSTFLDNDFGYACSVRGRRSRNDLEPINAAQLKSENPENPSCEPVNETPVIEFVKVEPFVPLQEIITEISDANIKTEVESDDEEKSTVETSLEKTNDLKLEIDADLVQTDFTTQHT